MEVKILNEIGVDFSKVRFDAQVLSTQCVCKFQCDVSKKNFSVMCEFRVQLCHGRSR